MSFRIGGRGYACFGIFRMFGSLGSGYALWVAFGCSSPGGSMCWCSRVTHLCRFLQPLHVLGRGYAVLLACFQHVLSFISIFWQVSCAPVCL